MAMPQRERAPWICEAAINLSFPENNSSCYIYSRAVTLILGVSALTQKYLKIIYI